MMTVTKNILKILSLCLFFQTVWAFTMPKKLAKQNLTTLQYAVDLSGIDLFWKVVDVLEKDQMPSNELWQEMFEHPAYAQIQKNGNRCIHLRRLMPMVFMPSGKNQLDSTLQSGTELGKRICRHLIEVQQNRKILEQYAESEVFEDMVGAAYELVIKYIPANSISIKQFPTIYVILFENNGFGYPNIVLDLQRLYSSQKICNILLIGHEAHHVFLHRLSDFQFPTHEDPYFPLVNALSGLQTEGIASMIDKQDWLTEENDGCDLEYQDEFRDAYFRSSEIFSEIDSLFTQVHLRKIRLSELTNIKSKFLWGGHANGMYMAKIIQDEKGNEYLSSLIYNPFDFIKGYNEAAKKSGQYFVFSDESMAFIKNAESQLKPK